MLVTFKCSAYADITMFGDVAKKLLDMMSFGNQVPGALRVEDVSKALENLRRGLATVPDQPLAAGNEDEDQPTTSLQTRALPLLELLQAAIADETRVRWE
jgi:hypothetical protein